MATWLGALLSFVLLPVASNIYAADELGKINYYFSIINIIFTFVVLGLDQAYLRFYSEYDKDAQRSQFTKNMLFTVLFTVGVGLICLPFTPSIGVWLVGNNRVQIVPIIVLHIIGLTVTRYFVILFRLKSKLLEYTLLMLVNTVLLKCMYLAGYPFGKDAVTGITATALISISLAGILFLIHRKELSFKNLTKVDENVKNEFKYAIPIIPAMVFAILNNNIPQIILRSKTSFSNIALYSIGVTIASTITLLHNGLNTFMEPYIFKNHKTEKKKIADILDLFTVAAYIICMLVILVQDWFFLVFKKDYIISTRFLPFLLTSSLWYTLGDFYNIGVKIGKKTKDNIPIYIIGFTLNAILSLILIPILDSLGAAISAATSSGLMSIMKAIKGNKYYKIIDSYKHLLSGAVVLLLVDIGNYLFWGNQIRYIFPICGILIYVVYTRAISNAIRFIKKNRKLSELTTPEK